MNFVLGRLNMQILLIGLSQQIPLQDLAQMVKPGHRARLKYAGELEPQQAPFRFRPRRDFVDQARQLCLAAQLMALIRPDEMPYLDGIDGRGRAGPIDPDMQDFSRTGIEKLRQLAARIGQPADAVFRGAGKSNRLMDAAIGSTLNAVRIAENLPPVPVSQSQVIELQLMGRLARDQMIVGGKILTRAQAAMSNA